MSIQYQKLTFHLKEGVFFEKDWRIFTWLQK